MKVKARDGNSRRYDYQFTLSSKEAKRLDIALEEVILNYQVQTRKRIAERLGYATEVYGEDNHNMVELSQFHYVIYDQRFQRILYKNVSVDSVDDF